MLTADLVGTRRKGDELFVRGISKKQRPRALLIADELIAVLEISEGERRADVEQGCADVSVLPHEKRLADGLKKLLFDRCDFAMLPGPPVEELRCKLFVAAATARREASASQPFDRDTVLASVAGELGLEPFALEARLYADLRQNQVLVAFKPIGPEQLLASYDRSLHQAVLLKAIRVEVDVHAASAGAYRQFFRKLKFLRLLHRIEPREDGYRVVIDGPFSLFSAVTKYGLQLALMLPALDACDRWKLRAELLWGKDKQRLRFKIEGGSRAAAAAQQRDKARLPDEVAKLKERFAKLGTPWKVETSRALLSLPGVGLCVPDLRFAHDEHGAVVYLEVMGYWSRDAVWKRVDLVEAGLPQKILFAVSSRLRVSEEVLDADASGALYVYKGAMHAQDVLRKLEQLSAV